MSTILSKKSNGYEVNLELFGSADECVKACRTREITNPRFKNMAEKRMGTFEGVKSYDEALDLLHGGYQPTVDDLRGLFKANMFGTAERFAFRNNIQGFAPVVPLALKGVPNCMLDMQMRPIKAKVLDVVLDISVSAHISTASAIEAGKKILGAVLELERQGYRFNVYVCDGFFDGNSGDMLAVKVKSAEQPLDLKRVSFPMGHSAFSRVIGFDWYSKFPKGKYRASYGYPPCVEMGKKACDIFRELFGKKNLVYFSIQEIIRSNTKNEAIKEVFENGKCKD